MIDIMIDIMLAFIVKGALINFLVNCFKIFLFGLLLSIWALGRVEGDFLLPEILLCVARRLLKW